MAQVFNPKFANQRSSSSKIKPQEEIWTLFINRSFSRDRRHGINTRHVGAHLNHVIHFYTHANTVQDHNSFKFYCRKE